MSFKIYPTEEFKKNAKKIKDVYPGFRNDLFEFAKKLKQNPLSFPSIDPLGDGLLNAVLILPVSQLGKALAQGSSIL